MSRDGMRMFFVLQSARLKPNVVFALENQFVASLMKRRADLHSMSCKTGAIYLPRVCASSEEKGGNIKRRCSRGGGEVMDALLGPSAACSSSPIPAHVTS